MRNDGKAAEGHVQEALKRIERTQRATWVRLYDSTSAGYGGGGSLIPEQPGDYILVRAKSGGTLIEVKSSVVHDTLLDTTLRSVFSENQIAGSRLWQRAGQQAICLFYAANKDLFEIWDMAGIREAFLSPPRHRKLQTNRLSACGSNTTHLSDMICTTLDYLKGST